MKPPHDEHITQEDYDAVCRERDKWAEVAMAERQRVLQLEEENRRLRSELSGYQQAEETAATLPHENKYAELAEWLKAEKALGRDYYEEAGYNRSKMCRNLRTIIGWEPNENSLRKAQNN